MLNQERENDFAIQKCYAVPIWTETWLRLVRETGPMNRRDRV
jgi:hypothetical protein